MTFALILGVLSANAKTLGVFCFLEQAEKQIYEDENIKLVIGVSDNLKSPVLLVLNKTDKVVYIDKENSFAYLNDNPTTLFSNSAQTSSQTNSQGASVNLGSVAGAFGVGGTVGSLLNGINVGGSSGTINGNIIYEKRVVSVAPKAAIVIYSWDDCASLLTNSKIIIENTAGTSKFINPGGSKQKFKVGLSRHYDAYNSPVRLKGVVKYSTSEDFADAKLVNTENYLKDIIIDSKKGVSKGLDFAPYTTPYLSQPCMQFMSGSLTPIAMVGAVMLGTAVGVGVIVGVCVLCL